MELTFTQHPLLTAPTDEEILLLAEKDPKLLGELHRAHEGRIRAAQEDPLRYGFDLAGRTAKIALYELLISLI